MQKLAQKYLGLVLVFLLSAAPILLWAFIKPLNLRFQDSFSILTSIGQVSGLLGTVLFTISLILSARVKLFDFLFNGINNAYLNHHNLGAISFSLLLLHPLSLAIKYAFISAEVGFNFLITSNLSIILGELGLLLMMFLMILTFFTKLKYETWKTTHKFLGLAFLLASLHVYLVPSDITSNMVLRWYMLAVIGLGFCAILYRSVFHKVLVKKYDYSVKGVNLISDDLVEVIMVPEKDKLKYLPGQFIFVSFNDEAVGKDVHPFSITSSPNDEEIIIAVKALGDYSSRMKLLRGGTKVKIEGPFGRFFQQTSDNVGQIWIAGGIGIAPFLSMARSLRPKDYEVDLYYCTSTKEELFFLDELNLIPRKGINFKMNPVCSCDCGRITAKYINERSRDVQKKDIYICGPIPMMISLKKQFIEQGVNKNKIHMEEFKLY